ncbi:MAG TPA: anti-anti-sigma factor [Methylococcaceae bacterium]|nr:anti-anti-sigma factor [Methylococcaceae bacterium]
MTHRLSLISKGNGRWLLHGELTFAGIHRKMIDSPPFLRQGKEQIILDLSQVTSTDSAGLALMIEWIKQTRAHRLRLHFKNIPNQLLNLAKLTGLDKAPYFSLELQKKN